MHSITKLPFCKPLSQNPVAPISFLQSFPYITSAICIFAILLTLSPQMTSWLQFDRDAILAGEFWRALTGHLTHWSSSHLIWDLLVFAVCSVILENLSRLRFFVCLLVSSLIISLLVILYLPQMPYYRGLSGIDNGLCFLLLAFLYRQNLSGRGIFQKMSCFTGGIFFIGKSVFELTTGHTLFVQSVDLFVPVPLAHIGGAFTGSIIGLLPWNDLQAKYCKKTTYHRS